MPEAPEFAVNNLVIERQPFTAHSKRIVDSGRIPTSGHPASAADPIPPVLNLELG
jgi:hypothetical protein